MLGFRLTGAENHAKSPNNQQRSAVLWGVGEPYRNGRNTRLLEFTVANVGGIWRMTNARLTRSSVRRARRVDKTGLGK